MSKQQTKGKKMINKTINTYKKKLMAKVEKKGIYENFGGDEIRKLEDKCIDSSDCSSKMRNMRSLIRDFSDWAMKYKG